MTNILFFFYPQVTIEKISNNNHDNIQNSDDSTKNEQIPSDHDSNYQEYIAGIMPNEKEINREDNDEEDMDLVNAEINCSMKKLEQINSMNISGNKQSEILNDINEVGEFNTYILTM